MLLDDPASTTTDPDSDSRRASHMNTGDPARSGSMSFSRAGSTASLTDSTIGGATGLAGATGRTLRQVCVTIDGTPNMPGLQGQLLTARWYARFDPRALTLAAKHYRSPGAGVMGRQNLVPQHGKRFTESVVVLHAPILPNARNAVTAPYFQPSLTRTMSIPGLVGSDDDDGRSWRGDRIVVLSICTSQVAKNLHSSSIRCEPFASHALLYPLDTK